MMNALVLQNYGNLVFTSIEKPKPSPTEVLVRIHSTGICGSDVHGFNGSTGRRVPPLVMGHEAAGVIETVGSDVTDFNPGERVTFDSTIYCGSCRFCLDGQVNFCNQRKVLGVGCDEYSQAGTFAEYICVPGHILYHLPDQVSFVEGAMVEPLSIAVHAVSLTPINVGDTAVVIGAGVIGLLTLQVLIASGCSRVFVADLDEDRLKLALELGAEETFNSGSVNLPEKLRSRTNERGVDCAIDAVGLSATVNTAIFTLKKGGALTIIGNFSPTIEFPLQYLVSHQIRVQGSNASSGEYPTCIDMIKNQRVNVRRLISEVAPLSEGALWIQRLEKGHSGINKVILEP